MQLHFIINAIASLPFVSCKGGLKREGASARREKNNLTNHSTVVHFCHFPVIKLDVQSNKALASLMVI